MNLVHSLAESFYDVFYTKEWPGDSSGRPSDLSIAEAYQVQDLVTKMRVDRGEEVVGYKVGCTSGAIRSQFGLNEPISGRLFRPYIHREGVEPDWCDYVNCVIEPEMVLRIGKDLEDGELTDTHLIDAIDYVSPGIEIHNFKFWFSTPSSQELIASGGIHAGLVIGKKKVPPGELSFANELFSVRKDGEVVTEAPASEIMGGPLKSLRWLVKSLAQRRMRLAKGSLVIPGSPVELVKIGCDTTVRIEIGLLGSLALSFQTGRIVPGL